MSRIRSQSRNLRAAALVIEPGRHLRRLVVSMLRTTGIQQIQESESHTDTLDKVRQYAFKLIVMNAQQGPLDYREVVSDIRHASMDGKCIPLILYGTELTHGQISNAQRDGIDLILMTPFSVATLVDRVDHVLHQKRYCQFCQHHTMTTECSGHGTKGARVAKSA